MVDEERNTEGQGDQRIGPRLNAAEPDPKQQEGAGRMQAGQWGYYAAYPNNYEKDMAEGIRYPLLVVIGGLLVLLLVLWLPGAVSVLPVWNATWWFDDHPYVLIYAAGCVTTFILSLLKVVLFYALNWVTKANILARNAKKIQPPESVVEKVVPIVISLALEMALSWIGALIVIWQIVMGLLRVVRELFSSDPEEIKLLRFPLRNNPSLSREAVWAYVTALNIKAGWQWNGRAIDWQLSELVEYYPSFNESTAIEILSSLMVVEPEVIENAKKMLEYPPDLREDMRSFY